VSGERDSEPPENGDIEKVARALIAKHRDKAAAVAEARAQQLLEDGEISAHSLWKRIVRVIRHLQRGS
jgi:hypothetical protein